MKSKITCPEWGKEINRLIELERKWVSTTVMLDGNGTLFFMNANEHEVDPIDDGPFYHCPECNEEVADRTVDAIRILRGEGK